jgi:hypothetical protein
VKSAANRRDISCPFAVSVHANQRMRQRGVRSTELMLLLLEADRETPVGEGCIALTISNARGGELLAEGYQQSVVERARKIAVVASATGEVMTILRPQGHRGRRYRRSFHTYRGGRIK